MENNNSSREIAEIVENSLTEFRKGMEAREQLSIRIGRRTTQIIRFGMTGMTILGLALFFLIFILTKDFATITDEMELMSGYMASMDSNFTAVATNISQVQKTLVVLNDNITVMPKMYQAVANMDTSLVTLSGDLTAMVEQIYTMNGSVSAMTANMQLLNKQFTDMNITVGHMAGNVRQMSKPMKMLPFQ